jgi:chaperone modulatory protein CbpM
MTKIETGILHGDLTLTLDEFAHACERDQEWVMIHVEAELIGSIQEEATVYFSSTDLTRARRLASIESMFDTNEDAAGFIVDLIEEVNRLRRIIKVNSF